MKARTTIVRRAVATVEPTPFMPILARMDVMPAKNADAVARMARMI